MTTTQVNLHQLLRMMVERGASDLHITTGAPPQLRIDGRLVSVKMPPLTPVDTKRLCYSILTEAQKGRFETENELDLSFGIKGLARFRSNIFVQRGAVAGAFRAIPFRIMSFAELGLPPMLSDLTARTDGLVLVTGPTGSGKSTTLYTALRHMDGDKLNISTVEDPVEYQLDFCNQIQVNEKIGLTFAGALRSLLRQDPDIVMVGEIRDNETARIAVQAALTGHLVLSTLHTNDAPSSITRLVNIGIDAYLIAASLNAVLAQRLVRKICPACKEPFKVPEAMLPLISKVGLQPEQILHGAGCAQCRGSGYSGRLGIYELLVVDDRLREMINSDASVAAMRRAFCEGGGATLFDDGMEKVRQGVTTLEEILRVTQVYGQNEQEDFAENR